MKILASILTAVLVLLYPVAIWFGLTRFDARTVGVWILLLLLPALVLRFRRAARGDLVAALRVPLGILAVVLLGVIFDDRRFVLAMPALINLALLLTFASSLASTPIVERFARMQERDGLEPAQIAHCRQVTWAWVVFFALNAATAAALAWVAPLSWWAAYNGGIAYALMGLMFAAEYLVRQYRFRRYGRGLHDRLLARILPPARAATEPALDELPIDALPIEQSPVERSPVERSPIERSPVEQSPVEQSPNEHVERRSC